MFGLAAVLLLGGCGHAAKPAQPTPAATVDPEIGALRVQLAQARAERDAALARLHALERRKPAVLRMVVKEPPGPSPRASSSSTSATQVFSNVSTAASPRRR